MKFRHTYKQDITIKTDTPTQHNHRNGRFFYAWFEAMHTRVDIVICDKDESFCIAMTEKATKRIEGIERMTNRFLPDSEISRLNLLAAKHAITVSDELFAIITDCIHYYHQTTGAFDITIQSFNNFRGGINNLELDPVKKSIFFRNPTVQIDLCGYIKGYALDQIVRLFKEAGINNALLNMGNSSIFALGDHPHGSGWKITHPSDPNQSFSLHNECLSSSGNSANHLHIIDPSTGKPAAYNGIQTIITPTATEGEVRATAMCIQRV